VPARAYLDYAGLGLVRPRARAAMHAAVEEVLSQGSPGYRRFFDAREQARSACARLLDCDPAEIALVPNTSTGLALVAAGLRWQRGDEVIVFDRDFPASVQPWRQLASAGVVLRFVPMREGGYDLADVAARIGPATRLIAVSQVHFGTGFRIDLDRLAAMARQAGVLVCVDAIQALGVLPLSVARTPVDFIAAGGHKWLGGPPGSGLFFCRRDRLDELLAAPAGWFGYDGASDRLTKGAGHEGYDRPLRPAARRFEGGMPPFVEITGFAAALGELEAAGLPAVAGRVRELTGRLRAGLAARGYRVLSPAGQGAQSGIVTFAHPGGQSREVYDQLMAAGCVLSYPDGAIRAAPHFWTTDEEIAAFLGALPTVAR
jgi:selenocysteine lyase/cysteine desulfurase